MGHRALIIAIQEYPSVTDGSIARELPGTLELGERFRDWLNSKWDSEHIPSSERQIIFCSEPVVAGGNAATDADIRRALLALKTAGQNATEEFYFLFSGHGFSFIETDTRSDMLISSNYETMELSGGTCLNLDATIYWLRQQLGPGKQYYFVDACRNELDGTRVRPTGLPPPSNPQTSGEATTYLLQSTIPSATAAADNGFSEALLGGLRGRSTAKIWDENDPDAMMVRYDSLRLYLKKRVPQPVYHKVEGVDGEAEAIILRLKPAPSAECTVEIEGGPQTFSGTVSSTGYRNKQTIEVPVTGSTTVFDLKPDRYTVAVQLSGSNLAAQDAMIYDDTRLKFVCKGETEPPKEPGPPPQGPVADIVIPPNATLELHEIQTGRRTTFSESESTSIEKGLYAAVLRYQDGRVVKTENVAIDSDPTTVNLVDWQSSAAQVSIANCFPTQNGALDFSESLGGYLPDPDLNVWLAILGAGRILTGTAHGDFHKISRLPLQDFSSLKPNSSPVYVLAGLEDAETTLAVAISKNPRRAVWRKARQPTGLSGVHEFFSNEEFGPRFVSFQVGQSLPYTLTSLTSPNRATLVTLTTKEDGSPNISQYLLPIGHLQELLHPVVADQLQWRNQLADVRMLAESARAFRNRRDVGRYVPDHFLDDILYTKWLDPIGSALVGYELIRRGRADLLPKAVQNLMTYFPELPDTWALASLAHIRTRPLRSVPLFLDGLSAFQGIDDGLPLPAASLDYSSPWTAWRAEPRKAPPKIKKRKPKTRE